jgi:disulfide bond formation protein DsbB
MTVAEEELRRMSTPIANDRESMPQFSPGLLSVLLPLAVAFAATFGSLWLSIGMGLKACPLCFYQRTFAMSVLAVLGIGLLAGAQHRNVLNLLSLPLAVGGFGVAAFHVSLEATGKLECPSGVMAIGTAPQQSLAIFGLLLVLVAWGVVRTGCRWPVSMSAFVLGVLLAVASVKSAPPMPNPPSQPYPKAPDICRPPYQA